MNRFVWLLGALLLATGSSLTARQLYQPSSAITKENFDVTYYRLKLRLHTSPNQLLGQVLIKAISKTDNLRTLQLDLMRSTMIIDSILMGAHKIHFLQDSAFFTVTLDRPHDVGELIALEIFYRNAFEGNRFGGFEFRSHGNNIPWIWSMGEPSWAKFWWPCKDHPRDKADSADIIVTVDSSLSVASNGKLVSKTFNGDGSTTFHWHERYPIASYLISIAISNYVIFSDWFKYSLVDSMEIINFALPEDLSDAKSTFRYALDGLSIFSKYFGLYPFIKEKYGHAQVVNGLENQTLTTISYLHFNEETVIHELAHQWFGDMITCRTWPDIWLNEGFATYCEALYREKKYGDSSYVNAIRSYMNSAMKENGTIFIQDTNEMARRFDPIVYYKGAVVLHMLRHILGDSTFFRAMYNYANDPLLKYNVASTADFQRVCKTTSGKNLSYFFNEWINGENYPKYKFTWIVVPEGKHYNTKVTLSQTTNTKNPNFFTMPVDIQFSAPGWDTTITAFNNSNNQRFDFVLSHKPTTASLDPGNWILKVIQ